MLRSSGQLQAHWDRCTSYHKSLFDGVTPIGFILTMEGADGIVSPYQLAEWFNWGLRVVGPVHYGHNQYAHGTGELGCLTESGVTLLREMERLGVILDATHLADASFFHSLDVFRGPVSASHQNCRTLVPGDRQFSDEQLRILIERGAVIGAPLDNWMIVPGWITGQTPRADATLEKVVDHIDHICQLAGSHVHVAIGTDLDGGYGTEQSPVEIETIADVQKLTDVLARRGYSITAIEAIFHGNWLQFFNRHLPPG